MLRQNLLLAAFFICGTLSAQEVIHEEPIGWRGGSIELHTIRDKSGNQQASILVNDDSIRVFLLNRQEDSIISEFDMSRVNQEKLRGGFIDQGKIYLFCSYKFPHGLHNYVINTRDGMIGQNLVIDEGSKEKVIDWISAGDHFLFFTINKKTSQFIIHNWRNQEDEDTFSYHFSDKSIWESISKSYGFSRDVNVAKVDEAGLPDVDVAGNQNKIYLVHDTLFLLLNTNMGITKVFTFDTRNKSISYREIKNEPIKILHNMVARGHGEQTAVEIAEGEYVDNSFLLDDKLYFISATEDRLHIMVSDFYSGKELQRFSAQREDTITFKNTPVIQEGKFYGFGVTRELTKTRQLLRKMIAGNAVIAALNDSSGISLMIGSNKEMQQMGSGGGTFMPTGGSLNTVTFVPSAGFSRSTWTKSVRFRMLLDTNDLHHIPGDMQTSINDRIEAYTENIKIPDGAENLFLQDGRYTYIYYNKKQKSLVFVRFRL
jgi:hypothetical protein